MNSKTIFDYLPAEVESTIKDYESSTRGLIRHLKKEKGPESILGVLLSNFSMDELQAALTELKNNYDPLMYFMIDHLIGMSYIIRKAYTMPTDDNDILIELLKESSEHPEKSKDIQTKINKSRQLKRLVMNEVALIELENSLNVYENNLMNNESFNKLYERVPEYLDTSLIDFLGALHIGDNLDIIKPCEKFYNDTIKHHVKEYNLIVSGSEWRVDEKTKRITINLLDKKRREKRRLSNIPIISIPMTGLLGITDSKYKYALNRYTSKTEMGLFSPDRDDSILDERVESELIRILFTAVYSYLEPMYKREHISSPVPFKFCIKVEEISQYLYGSNTGLTSKFDEIVEKMRYTAENTEGMAQEKRGPVSLKVVDEMESDPNDNTITFTTPYISHIVTNMLKDGHDRAVRKMREREKKESAKAKKQNRDEVESIFYDSDFPAKVSYLEKPSLVIQRDEDAKAIVREILTWVKSANVFDEVTESHSESKKRVENVPLVDGTTDTYTTDRWTEGYSNTYYQVGTFSKGKNKGKQKNNEIRFSTLIDRVPTLKKKLETLQNRTVTLSDTFTHAWMYLYKYTRFKDDYPYLVFPGNNMKGVPGTKVKGIDELNLKDKKDEAELRKWVPTVKTMDDLKIILEPVSKEKQIKK